MEFGLEFCDRLATNTARGVSGLLVLDVRRVGTARTPPDSPIGTGVFGRIDRVVDFRAFLVFFAGTDILLSESR